MAQQVIAVGAAPNDGTGDPLRTAFTKANDNFTELYGGASFPAAIWGDGSDGDVTVSSGVTTLTRDMFYNNLTVSGTGQIATANFKIFVRGTLDISAAPDGAIVSNGLAGGNGATAGTAGTAGVRPALGTTLLVGLSNAGGAGGTAAGSNGGQSGGATSAITGGTGVSGAGGLGSGGAGGTATTTAPPANINPSLRRLVLDFIHSFSGTVGAYTSVRNGGGGGGGGDGTAGGGGGGGGGQGGCVAIWAATINRGTSVIAGIIQAMGGTGGNGGSATAGNRGGGGGGTGGPGGLVYIAYGTLLGSTITDAIDVSGGAGGSGGNGFGTGIGGNGAWRGGRGRVIRIAALAGSGAEFAPDNGSAGSIAAGVTGGAGGGAVVARTDL